MAREEASRLLLAEIREFCSTHGDEETITRYAGFFKEGIDEIEVATERANELAQRFYRTCGFDEEHILLSMELGLRQSAGRQAPEVG